MTRYLARLAIIGLLIVLTPGVILLLGFSGTAATLGAILAAALLWVPTLLALEGLSRVRRLDRLPVVTTAGPDAQPPPRCDPCALFQHDLCHGPPCTCPAWDHLGIPRG